MTEVKSEAKKLRSEIAEFRSDFRDAFAELKTYLTLRLGGLIVICTIILGVLIKS